MKYYLGKLKHYGSFEIDEMSEVLKFWLDEKLSPAEVLELVASEWHLSDLKSKPKKFPTEIPNVFEYNFGLISVVVSGYQEIDKATYDLLQIIPEVDIEDWFLEETT